MEETTHLQNCPLNPNERAALIELADAACRLLEKLRSECVAKQVHKKGAIKSVEAIKEPIAGMAMLLGNPRLFYRRNIDGTIAKRFGETRDPSAR